MKYLSWFRNHVLLVVVLFLLAFIPLYPKLPLIGINHTWVYIRVEDFLLVVAFLLLGLRLLRKKATLLTPLTIPILFYWFVGAIATLYGVIFIFPHIADVFPQVAAFHFFRRVEYLAVFFLAYNAVRDKKDVRYLLAILSVTLIAVILYGFGQKGFLVGFDNRFPAFSTMNEEFAKGIPLRLSSLARVSSTFAGHYDLAAYLVMLIAIMWSVIFGVKKYYLKIYFFITGFFGFILLLMTSSRVSFIVYLLAVIFMLMLQKKKLFIIPLIILSFFVSRSFDGLTQRFNSTISEADIVVDARTGKAIGIARTITTAEGKKKIVIEEKLSTGESLPQGSGYINIPSDGKSTTITEVTYSRTRLKGGIESTEVTNLEGNYILKKVLAYDVSFTTRFQGTWPRAWNAFQRNIFLGSGFSSISLATDGNYLRILGETGLFGALSYFSIFLFFGIVIKKTLKSVSDPLTRSFIIGICAAVFGVALNAILIDAFDASKVAFVMWMLIGVAVSFSKLYHKDPIDYVAALKVALLSFPALILYLLFIAITVLSMMLSNYFVGDDFTWLRWATDCKKVLFVSGATKCEPVIRAMIDYFTNAHGFFYRPGTKMYFYYMFPWFSFNQYAYHIVSLALHVVVSSFVLLLSAKVLRSKLFAFITAVSFLLLSINAEILFWISSTGHLVTFLGMISGLVFFIYWKDTHRWFLLPLSFLCLAIAPLFHEVGVVGPLLLIAYDLILYPSSIRRIFRRWYLWIFLIVPVVYLFIRSISQSHWTGGDYNYNLAKLPFNTVGNFIGYITSVLIGTRALPYVEALRVAIRHNLVLAMCLAVVLGGALILIFYMLKNKATIQTKKIILLSLALTIIPLLPFLGLGNIAPRYVYLASVGILIFAVFLLQRLFIFQYKKVGKTFAYVSLGLITCLYVTFNIIELQRINKDWKKAGEITQQIIFNFQETYVKHRSYSDNPVFYFVNVPIRWGEAWVFPVGLPDAVWFNFQSENLTIKYSKSIDLAFGEAEGSGSAKVFDFDKDGNIAEVFQKKSIKIVPLK